MWVGWRPADRTRTDTEAGIMRPIDRPPFPPGQRVTVEEHLTHNCAKFSPTFF